MGCNPIIRAGRQFFFSVFPAVILVAPLLLFPALTDAFAQRPFISHPPEQKENSKTVPRHPLSRPAKGKFLVAGRNLDDPNFSRTVVLIIDHSASGTLGVVINRPSGLKLSSVFPDMKGMKDISDNLHIGGPVAVDRLTLLLKTRKEPEASSHVFEDVYAGGKPEAIIQMLDRVDPKERFRAYLGYSGWGPGQLEAEVARADWHILQADAATIFDKEHSKIWPELILLSSSKWVHLEVRSLRPEINSLHSVEPRGFRSSNNR